jgi:hypothetical protein
LLSKVSILIFLITSGRGLSAHFESCGRFDFGACRVMLLAWCTNE